MKHIRSVASALRNASRTSSSILELSYEKVNAPSPTLKGPLVICHGLFGSKQNWRSLSKAFATQLCKDVYSLDLRNHGASAHNETMSYTSMASDVLHFCRTHRLNNITLLGHSMGGKVAMAFALEPTLPPDILSELIVVDIAPSNGSLSQDFQNYIEAMVKIEQAQIRTRKEANDILYNTEKDTSIRAFLLTNLVSNPGAPLKFRVPVDIIKRSLEGLGTFPWHPGERIWDGKVLLVKGEKSKYINKNNIPVAQQFFPKMRVETLNTGHWVHAERPLEFVDLVAAFIQEA